MKQNSRNIESNQSGPHDRLVETVKKHLAHTFQKPIADHTQVVFDTLEQQLAGDSRSLILDACCGVGDSSRHLATNYPDHLVIGIDKSNHRLSRERDGLPPENLILVRADLNDFYRLAHKAGWKPARHYILYPNPWPKSVHLGRRWHGAPVFPSIIGLGGHFEMRSNWKLYLEEFQIALTVAGYNSTLTLYNPDGLYLTPFEKKYHESGQMLWRLEAFLSN
ncbi:tRNA (guanine(46)-N(7))-methyltransferase TrmB [Kordiimonas pumila]|uniref:tRNA (guanine(46)-N(7))-methyltransferase n=1 Tax=Kordiimonas pumila TaxID=2161677 RepID=A0ABV7DAI0_9PROT|nr:SAM-dependent methyltransferase [Kordiimonas pumila]